MAQTQKVRGVATTIARKAQSISVQYHSTTVAEVHRADGIASAKASYVTLDTGGYRTNTTKTRMNQFANEYCSGAFSVYQKAGDWFVIIDGVNKHVPFECNTMSFYILSDKVRY